MLQGVQIDRIRRTRVVNDGVGAEPKMAGGSNEAAAPISKTVAVGFNRNRRGRYQIIRTLQFRDTREVHVQRDNHRRYLRKLEVEIATESDTHQITPAV